MHKSKKKIRKEKKKMGVWMNVKYARKWLMMNAELERWFKMDAER